MSQLAILQFVRSNLVGKLNRCLTLAFGLFIVSCFSFATASESESLQLTPNQCVTLKQGNRCYLDLGIKWQAPGLGHYCLYLENRLKPLKCWQDSRMGMHHFEFSEAQSTQLSLRDEGSGTTIAVSQIEVKWVYRSRSRSTSWRVF